MSLTDASLIKEKDLLPFGDKINHKHKTLNIQRYPREKKTKKSPEEKQLCKNHRLLCMNKLFCK